MDTETQILWILLILAFILNQVKYLRNPINFSSKEVYFVTYHNLYFAIEIIILICFTIFIRQIIDTHLPFENFNTTLIYIPIIISFLITYSYKRKPIEGKHRFKLPPDSISKFLTIILILSVICLVGLIYISNNKFVYPILIANLYLLMNNYTFLPCKYNLPSTFNK